VNDLPGGADRLVTDAEGVQAVMVNGQLIRERGEDQISPDAALPGVLLRGGCAAPR
jgi:N-acyl-D-amino-acid deacylase